MWTKAFALMGALIMLPLVAACGGSHSKPAQSPTAAGLPTTAASARLPGPRLFEALAQSAGATILVQVDLSGLIHVEYEDAQAVSHTKNCQAEATAPFKEVLALSKNVSPVNTKLPPEAAAALLGMYQLAESGGLERLVVAGIGQAPLSDDDRAAISRLLATVATGCRP